VFLRKLPRLVQEACAHRVGFLNLAVLFPAIEVVDKDDGIGDVPRTARVSKEVLIYTVAQLAW
jgi:hypothetical protein